MGQLVEDPVKEGLCDSNYYLVDLKSCSENSKASDVGTHDVVAACRMGENRSMLF